MNKPYLEINRPYIGEIVRSELLELDDTKVYFTNIKGRDPKVHEWDSCDLSQETLIDGLRNQLTSSKHWGIPHIAVAFPHVTALYRFGDPRQGEQETNVFKVGLGETPKLDRIIFQNLLYGQPMVGCPAEIFVLGEEMKLRASAESLQDYLSTFIPNGPYEGSEIVNPNMVRDNFIEERGYNN